MKENRTFGCCDSLRDQVDCSVKETEKGVQIDIKPKDPAKAGSLQALVKACKEFCGCC